MGAKAANHQELERMLQRHRQGSVSYQLGTRLAENSLIALPSAKFILMGININELVALGTRGVTSLRYPIKSPAYKVKNLG